MTISHHIPDETLLAYGAGSLSEAWSLLVATHLALCPTCRALASRMEGVGGALLDGLAPADVSDDAFGKLMQTLDDSDLDMLPEQNKSLRAAPAILPQPLRAYLGGDLYALKWRRLGMGVFHIPIKTGPIKTGKGKVSARLLRVPAGQPVPMHSHNGDEMTLVLVGSFLSYQGNFGRGDVELADPSVEHMPIAAPGEDCICLAVTDAPLRFKSLAARLLQPFLGI